MSVDGFVLSVGVSLFALTAVCIVGARQPSAGEAGDFLREGERGPARLGDGVA